MNLQKRNSALDILRIFALFSVIGVHFFLNTGYYDTPMLGGRMLVLTVIRTGFMVCVPLFIMLTGYLMSKKTLSAGYYKGIVKTIFVYIAVSVICILYKRFHIGQDISLLNGVQAVFNFTGASYGWYIEMYIGLFILIPFINLMYNGLPSKKGKLALVITMLALTAIPSVLNIYNFSVSGWFKTPYLSTEYHKIAPSWWTDLYPLTYYFLGAYLREYPVKLKKWLNILLVILSVTVFGAFNYYRSWGGYFSWGIYTDWFALPTVIMSVLVFIFFANRDTSRLRLLDKKILATLSDACLGAYLVSYIFDSAIYEKFNGAIPNVLDRINCFLPITITVTALSLAASYIINLVYAGIKRLVNTACTLKKGNQ